MTEAELKIWRAQLRPSSLLSLEEVAEALPHADVGWVRRNITPIGDVDRRPIFMWSRVLEALGISLQEETPPRPSGPLYISYDEARERLGVSFHTLRGAMADTPEGKEVWVNTGSSKHPRYRWRAEGLQEWWEEVPRWRLLSKSETVSKSFGGKGAGAVGSGRGRSTRKSKRGSLKPSSRPPKSEANNGRLRKWAEGRSSRRSIKSTSER